MIDSLMECWQRWLLMLLALPLLFRTLGFVAEGALLARRGRWGDVAAMLERRSQSAEWESRAMTLAVAIAGLLLSFHQTAWAEAVLMAWMGLRWARFTKDRRAASWALACMVCVAGLVAVGERL